MNVVMLRIMYGMELGKPLHAFDYDEINEKNS